MARRTLNDILASGSDDLDEEKLDATTDDDVRRYKAQDGYDFTPTGVVRFVVPEGDQEKPDMAQIVLSGGRRAPLGMLAGRGFGATSPNSASHPLPGLAAGKPIEALEAPGSGRLGLGSAHAGLDLTARVSGWVELRLENEVASRSLDLRWQVGVITIFHGPEIEGLRMHASLQDAALFHSLVSCPGVIERLFPFDDAVLHP